MGDFTADLIGAMAALFIFVFLKAFQQRNVAFDHYLPVIPTSIGMSICEFYVIGWVAIEGFSVFKGVALGIAGGTGAILSMYIHKRVLGTNSEEKA